LLLGEVINHNLDQEQIYYGQDDDEKVNATENESKTKDTQEQEVATNLNEMEGMQEGSRNKRTKMNKWMGIMTWRVGRKLKKLKKMLKKVKKRRTQ